MKNKKAVVYVKFRGGLVDSPLSCKYHKLKWTDDVCKCEKGHILSRGFNVIKDCTIGCPDFINGTVLEYKTKVLK